VEDISWHELAPSLIPELFRREIAYWAWQGWKFDSGMLPRSTHLLIATWDTFSPQVVAELSFVVMFYYCVGRPRGVPLAEVRERYDRRWGRLPEDIVRDIVMGCAALRTSQSILDHFALLHAVGDASTFGSLLAWAENYNCVWSVDYLCEVILWAEAHRWKEDCDTIPLAEWPRPLGPRPTWRMAPYQKRHGARTPVRQRRRKAPRWFVQRVRCALWLQQLWGIQCSYCLPDLYIVLMHGHVALCHAQLF